MLFQSYIFSPSEMINAHSISVSFSTHCLALVRVFGWQFS